MGRRFRAAAATIVAVIAAIGGTAAAADPLETLLRGAGDVMTDTEGDHSRVYFPAIANDPNTGITVGPLPVFLWLNEEKSIRHIVAPSLTWNEIFGVTGTFRYYFYPEPTESLFLLGSISWDTNHRLALRYKNMRAFGSARRVRFEINQEAKGGERFFGFGSRTDEEDETNFTLEKTLLTGDVSLPFARDAFVFAGWELYRTDVKEGAVDDVVPIAEELRGIRIENGPVAGLQYDSRDFPGTPTRGSLLEARVKWSHETVGADDTFVRLSLDGSTYRPHAGGRGVLALRFHVQRAGSGGVPFPSQTELGGDRSLRGFGDGRFIDRGAVLATIEERWRFYRLSMMNALIDFEVAPFFDVGTVFRDFDDIPDELWHPVGGVGLRGVVRPTVVGKVDVGYGRDGFAIFTGIDYPF